MHEAEECDDASPMQPCWAPKSLFPIATVTDAGGTGTPRRRGRSPKGAATEGIDYEAREAARSPEPASSPEPDDEEAMQTEAAPGSIAARVRDRLAAAKGADASQVQVEVERGVVILSGYAPNDAMRQRIVDVVSAAGGVRVIRNRIRLSG